LDCVNFHEFLASACMKVCFDQRRVDLDQARFVVGGSLDRCGWAPQNKAVSNEPPHFR
jgi:hypothetical protein